MKKNKTIFEKIWDSHLIESIEEGPDILYIDRHYIHEVTSPQAFDGLREKRIKVFRPLQTVGTADHNVPTKDQHLPIREELSRYQVQKLTDNCKEFDIKLYGLNHPYQGIVHVIGPELGLTLPGMTIVCGDSHTSTHGAFGTIAFGIGTSEVEMVLAAQCLMQNKPKTMKIQIDGEPPKKVTSKDIILYIISKITSSGGTGYFVEYTGSTIASLSMEARMTICNMSIEMGARGGIIAPDETTFQYIKNREFAPKGLEFETYKKYWETLATDEGAIYDKKLYFQASDIEPMITYGTNPGMGIKISETIPMPSDVPDVPSFKKALAYMGLEEGVSLKGKIVNYVFIGSCTNARIEDLRLVAQYVKGKKKAKNVNAWVIPGSKQVEKQAISEGIDKILIEAGFEFRGPGCSACLGMNEDKIPSGEYCISTSNRNFEGRQGPGARTFLASPITAATTAINGFITDPRDVSVE